MTNNNLSIKRDQNISNNLQLNSEINEYGLKKRERKYSKSKIPKKIREEVWINYNGKIFSAKCNIDWCNNNIDVFNFHVGHDKPESKGGTLDIVNLKPICVNCNLSMSNNFTITEWKTIGILEREKVNYLKNIIILLIFIIVSLSSTSIYFFRKNNH